ncbi:putative ribonuclease H-like domain-containing protein [Tanacetum coccineum]
MSNNSETNSEISLSVFDVRSSDEESTLANNRFSKADGYHAVPPTITGNFLTLRANISFAGLDEYAIRKKIIELKTTKLNADTSKSKTSETVGKTNEANTQKTKIVYESVNRDKVIIEDWNSNDEDNVSEANPEILLQDHVVVDSGCFSHMTGNKAYLSDYEDYNGGFVAFGIDPKGDELNFKLPDESQVVLRAPRKDDVYSLDLKNFYPEADLVGCDNGTEFKNHAMNEFCAKKGIKREFSVARTPQQNGVAERKNRTLIEAARTMLADSLLPIPFWAEAVNTACYVLNRVLVTKPQNKTPYELLIGKSPSISFMRPFGCPLTILNTLDSLGKFDGKSDEGYLLGYSTSSKAFRVYNKRTKRVEENLHINFLEDQPNVTGTGPNWMFDLDFLTNSMNYIPVSVENQVNVDAGTQDSYVVGSSGKDKGPTQEYILLPLQPHRTRIPIEDVAPAAHEKPSESSPKDNDIQDSEDVIDKEGQHQMPEDEQVLHDELEKMVTQELTAKAMDDVSRQAFKEEKRRIASQKKAAQATSTNKLSTDRQSVSTDRPSVSTDRPSVSTDRPFVQMLVNGKIPIDASTLPNVDLPIDPNMPDLRKKETSDTLLNDGIFNGAYDDDKDVGAVADFNNMDNTIVVSLIPTLRIHKDYPKGQILGDPTLAVQTRGKIQKASSTQQALVSYIHKQNRTNHKDHQNCLFACFLSQEEPKTISQALQDESWFKAMQEELLQFKLQKVWVLVDLRYGKKVIGTKWVFRNKRDERSIVVKNKARLIAQGFRQEECIDYDEVFTPVARIEAIRLFLAFASCMGFTVYQMDVKSAFLYGTIKEEVYVHQPPGFVDPVHPNKVYKVIKSLYGLHQAPRAWYETLSSFLMENGFRRGTIDKTLFIKKNKSDIMLVQVYVDDIIFGSTKKSMCTEFEDCMHKRFQMSSMGEITFFLGLQVKQQLDGIFISQDKYVADILKKFDFLSIRIATTPIESNKPLVKDEYGEDVDVHVYISMIGSLMYLTASRPDIMFVVCICARFQVIPKASHLNAVKRIFRYLKHQPKLGLWYPRDSPFELEAFSDSDYGGASLDRKSTTGGCQFLGRGLISWQCKKQTIVENSTTEAEYVTDTNCCGQSRILSITRGPSTLRAHFVSLAHPYTATHVAQAFLDDVYKLHGLPQTIVSDRERVFISLFWKTLFKLLKTKLYMSTVYHTAVNRMANSEVVNGQLSLAEYWYNTNFHTSINTTPFEVVYGQPPAYHVPCVIGTSSVNLVDRTLAAREKAINILKFYLRRAQDRMKAIADGHIDLMKLVLEKIGDVAYKLQLPSTAKVHPVFHVSQLKRCKTPETRMGDFPTCTEGLIVVEPEKILDRRLQKKGNSATLYVLMQWANSSIEDATWEWIEDLQRRFPQFKVDA